MPFVREDPRGVPPRGPIVRRRGLLAAALALLGLLGVLSPAGALDYTGRIDTRYRLMVGDNAFDNDLYNYHSLELAFLKNLTFSWYGGVLASLSERTNSRSADGIEYSNNAMMGLQDASNTGQLVSPWLRYVNYRIYSAYLKWDAGVFGALLGRYNPVDYDFAQFDGLMLWTAPFEWLRLEAFGGLPWHYAYAADLASIPVSLTSGEMVAGGGVDLRFFDDALKLGVKYLFLRETTRADGLISSSPDTYLSSDSLAKGSLSFEPWPWLNAGAGGSLLGLSPLSVRAWVSGVVEPVSLSYSAGWTMQLFDVSQISGRITEFSSLLTASHPYLDLSATVTENLAAFFPRGGFLSDAELELGYEHRQPVNPADLAMFNPQYDQFRVGVLVGATGGWSLSAFYAFLLTSGVQNTLHVVGGELGKKWSFLDIRLGSSFNASLYETDYTQTVVQDSFYAQEYYFRVKWQINRSFDVSLKAAYENALLTSITSGPVLNSDVFYAGLTGLNNEARSYLRFDVRAGFRY